MQRRLTYSTYALFRSLSIVESRRVPGGLDVAEERTVDGYFFDLPDVRLYTEAMLLKKLAQSVAVDEVNRRRAIARCLLPRLCCERSGRDQQPAIAAPSHRSTEVAHGTRADAAAITLALKEHGKTDQREPVDPNPVNTAV